MEYNPCQVYNPGQFDLHFLSLLPQYQLIARFATEQSSSTSVFERYLQVVIAVNYGYQPIFWL